MNKTSKALAFKILEKSYTTKELLDFLWKVKGKIEKQPELAPHHKFAKDYAKTIIVFDIIHALEQGELKMFGEGSFFK